MQVSKKEEIEPCSDLPLLCKQQLTAVSRILAQIEEE